MNPDLLRYSCQMALPGFTEQTQKLLQNSKVLIVGIGGLGCPAAIYLASSGIGTLGLADSDTISLSNLHRQVLYFQEEVNLKKVEVAKKKLQKQNPSVEIISYDLRITSLNVLSILEKYDIVMDCSDNFETKYLLNDACVILGKPLIHGTIYQYEGQVAVWNVKNDDGSYSPNYRDVFPEVDATLVPDCNEGGVIPSLAGIIGCMQANEVIKYISKTGQLLSGKLLIFNSQNLETKILQLGKQTHTEIKELKNTEEVPMISVEQLKQKMISENFDLIDVRTAEERDNFNIGGMHLPISGFDYNEWILNKNKCTVIYCASGNRSNEVVKKLKILYPESDIYSLEGGLKSWIIKTVAPENASILP